MAVGVGVRVGVGVGEAVGEIVGDRLGVGVGDGAGLMVGNSVGAAVAARRGGRDMYTVTNRCAFMATRTVSPSMRSAPATSISESLSVG